MFSVQKVYTRVLALILHKTDLPFSPGIGYVIDMDLLQENFLSTEPGKATEYYLSNIIIFQANINLLNNTFLKN